MGRGCRDECEQDIVDEPHDDDGDDELEGFNDNGIGDLDGYHEQCGLAVTGTVPWSVKGCVA